MKRKYIKYIVVFAVIFIIIRSCCFEFLDEIFGNSRSLAESYLIIDTDYNAITKEETINILYEEEIIDILYEFQSIHPEYRLITTNEKGEKYHEFETDTDNASSSLVFFYFKDIDKTVSCFPEIHIKDDAVISLIRLYAVSDGVHFRGWRGINDYKEITRKENRMIKKKFEKEILDRLGVKWKRKRWWQLRGSVPSYTF
ncbi:MAG TPA: hypothetical protein PK662_09715 [Bacteroidales bacterium]|nr:hypothetical protein [Bacteroidales bacterium]